MTRNVNLSIVALSVLVGACSSTPSTPSAPTTASLIPSGTYQSALTAVSGTGIGGVSVSPVAIPSGTFDAMISVRLAQARPNTTYVVQRAPEIGRTLGSDGICQRSLGLSPWSPLDPPAPAFVTFPLSGSSATVTTTTAGAASLDFEFLAPTIPAGTSFDVMFRLVDNETAPTLELRSGCFTVLVK